MQKKQIQINELTTNNWITISILIVSLFVAISINFGGRLSMLESRVNSIEVRELEVSDALRKTH